MAELTFDLQNTWPKLAWVAVLSTVFKKTKILHGPMVEIREDWAVEAVWAGSFKKGDFDRTDLIFGTGIRQRDSKLIFVSSATGIDRLWHVQYGDNVYVSNSLPGILSVSKLSLLDSYQKSLLLLDHIHLTLYLMEHHHTGH